MDVRERQGIIKTVNGADQAITVDEREDCIRLAANDGLGVRLVFITPSEARHLSSRLRRIARRIDERLDA